MKRNKIKITKDNIKEVYGRLNKFFIKDRSFSMWFNYDCGFKPRIKKKFNNVLTSLINNSKFVCKEISITPNQSIMVTFDAIDDKTYIIDLYVYVETLNVGDVICFMGNRIVVKRSTLYPNKEYEYYSYQLN